MVRVKWLKSPHLWGYAHRIGESCLVEKKMAKEIEVLGGLVIMNEERPPIAKTPMVSRSKTRPVKKNEKSS